MTLASRRVVIGKSVVTIVAKDTFTDVSGTNLTAHTMDVGAGWTVSAGSTFNISGTGTLFIGTAGAGHPTATTNVGTANCTVSATPIVDPPTNDYGMAVRYIDANNYILINFKGDCFKFVAGAATSLGSFAACAIGDTLSIAMSLNAYTISKNGVSVLTFSDAANNTGTSHGARSNGGAGQWDNFLVTVP